MCSQFETRTFELQVRERKQSFQSSHFINTQVEGYHPYLFTTDNEPRPAYHAIQTALEAAVLTAAVIAIRLDAVLIRCGYCSSAVSCSWSCGAADGNGTRVLIYRLPGTNRPVNGHFERFITTNSVLRRPTFRIFTVTTVC